MSQTEPEPLPEDDMSPEIRMQSTTEQGRRNRSRIPLDVKIENLLALSNSVDKATSIAGVKIRNQATARSLSDSLDLLHIWPLKFKTDMAEADPPLSNLRILGKLDGPRVATLLNVLEDIEEDLRWLSAYIADYRLYGPLVTQNISSSSQTNTFWTGFSVRNFARHVAESKPPSIV